MATGNDSKKQKSQLARNQEQFEYQKCLASAVIQFRIFCLLSKNASCSVWVRNLGLHTGKDHKLSMFVQTALEKILT
jgi:hypothetical protein